MSEVNLKVELYTKTLLDKFDNLKKAKTGLFTTTLDLQTSINFFISSLDEAIKYAQANLVVGTEKKEFVLGVIGRLYDTVISPKLPYVLYPWSSTIKDIVVNKLISALIDYIVALLKRLNFA